MHIEARDLALSGVVSIGDNRMKKLAELFLLLFSASAFAPHSFSQSKKVEIKGHTIGESVTEFLSKEPAAKTGFDNCQRESENPKSRWYKKHRAECSSTLSVFSHGGRGLLPGNPRWTLDAGKLVKVEMDNMLDNFDQSPADALADLIKKFGRPTDETPSEFQNGFGARWTTHLYVWSFPDAHVQLYVDPRPSSTYHSYGSWMLEAETAAEHQQKLAAKEAKAGVFDK